MRSAGASGVAVVIPGRNCAATLRTCLEALLPLLDDRLVERIIFVDDHSTDGTRRIAESYPIEVLSSPARGAGAARNAGWRAAPTQQIWFVDADCVVEPDALSKLQYSMTTLGAAVVGGSYANQSAGSLVADLIHEEMVSRHQSMGREVTFAITANLLCRRECLAALNGFDESLRLGQDLDFAYRVVRSGRRLGFDATSRVAHFHETRLWSYLLKQARQGFWRMHIYLRHPARMRGDTYSGLLDYVQPPLALLVLGAPLAGGLIGAPVLGGIGAAVGAAALVVCQLPRTVEVFRSKGEARYFGYVPFGCARALFRGVGMLSGIVSVGVELASSRTPGRRGSRRGATSELETPVHR